jgi:uncharacterized protein (TIGR04255 family)
MAETHSASIDFEEPPVSEVICGVRFPPLIEMTVAQLGDFCRSVRRQLPEVSSGRLAAPVPQEMVRRPIPPLPRTIATAKDGSEAIQIQQNQFVYNWAKSGKGGQYPHFEKIFEAFQDYLSRFTEFVENANLGPLRMEGYVLNYVNHIDVKQGWSQPSDTSRFLRGFEGLPHDHLKDFHWHPTYTLGDDLGDLEIIVDFRTRSSDSARVLRFEIEVSYDLPKEGAAIDLPTWFMRARREVDRMFIEMTTSNAQTTVWKRRD